jgi:hypothetical protein
VPADVRLRAFRAFVAGHGERSLPRLEPVVSGRQDPGYLDELPALLAGVDAPAARVLEARVADALRRRGAPLPNAQDVVSEQAPR